MARAAAAPLLRRPAARQPAAASGAGPARSGRPASSTGATAVEMDFLRITLIEVNSIEVNRLGSCCLRASPRADALGACFFQPDGILTGPCDVECVARESSLDAGFTGRRVESL